MRWLIFAVIVLLIYLFIKKRLRDRQLGRQIRKTDSRPTVRCDYCGVFLPESEVLAKGGNNFCCREHYELAKQKNMQD